MGEVTGLYKYPFTGGLPNSLESMLVCAAGPDGNRRFVAYDPEKGEAVSQRHCNAFYGATAVAAAGSLEIVWRDGSSLVVPAEQDGELVTVSEYDVLTPLIDMGDKVAHSLSTYAGRDLRLGQKSPDWMAGHGIPLKERNVAPIHIIFEESVAALAARAGRSFGPERFQPNVTVAGFEPRAENAMVGGRLRIGSLVIADLVLAERCGVPSHHPETGENLKDVATVYPELPKGDKRGKPAFGLYGYPEVEVGAEGFWVSLHDEVEFLG
jgi:uncharacterized protein YcbX